MITAKEQASVMTSEFTASRSLTCSVSARPDHIKRLEGEASLLMLRWILGSSLRSSWSYCSELFFCWILRSHWSGEGQHQGSTRFCVGQLLSSCSLFGVLDSGAFLQLDAGCSWYRRNRHQHTTKLVCVRLIDKTVNSIHHLQRADQSKVRK